MTEEHHITPSRMKHLNLYVMGFVLVILFLMPVIFTRVNGSVSWLHVFKIWIDQSLLIPLFIINHWLLVPRLMLRRRYFGYLSTVLMTILLFSFSYKTVEESFFKRPENRVERPENKPEAIPPYAHLMIYSLLIAGVDTGLLFSGKWHENEQKKNLLEKRNTEMQLNILRNQISPHFFMNTLNNIYALIDCDAPRAKTAVMRLSKLMRYMLYENENGKVRLSKEFEFIQSYIDLMKLRFTDELQVRLDIPNEYTDVSIPPLLFVSFIENAFKHGASYEEESYIHIAFRISGNQLILSCENTRHDRSNSLEKGGLGMENSRHRLDLLYGKNYALTVNSQEDIYSVELQIPLT